MYTRARIRRAVALVIVGAGLAAFLASRNAWAVDSDGDGRHQVLSSAIDPTDGREIVLHAWTTVATDAEMEVELNVKTPGSAPFWREHFYNRGTFTNFSCLGFPAAWMQSGDRVQLVARYRTDSGALVDTETLEITIP